MDFVNTAFTQAFDDIQFVVYQTAVDHGWYENVDQINDGEKIALMHSELSEVLEALREGDGASEKIPGFSKSEEEFADTIIRIMDFAEHRGLQVGAAIIAKDAYNKTRPYKHGGKKF